MKKYMKKIYLIILIAAGALIIAGSVYSILKPKPLPYEFITTKKQNISQEVSVTGKVKAVQDVDLGFEIAGKISAVNVQVGEAVENGRVLVELESSQAQAQLNQALAALEQYQAAQASQQAKLAELKIGTRPEELQISQTAVINSQKALLASQTNLQNTQNKAATDLANLYDDVKDILSDSYLKADDAVNKQTSELFSGAFSDNPKLNFSVSNSLAQSEAEWQSVLARNSLKTFKTELDSLNSNDQTQLDSELIKTTSYLETVNNYLSKVNEAVNYATGLSQTTQTTYQGYVNTGRANTNTALTNVNNQKQLIAAQKAANQQNIASSQANVTAAQNNLDTSQKELLLKQAGATKEQLDSQEALLRQAQANVASQQAQIQNLEAQLNKTKLKSPINGVVTKMEAKIGEIASPQAVIASVIAQGKFQIEANIPEADIAKVKINDTAKVTLDAYGADTMFGAVVIKIDPAATIIEGVGTYKTTLQFQEESGKIKSGMTANITIATAQKENVLAVPYRAITKKDGAQSVKKIKRINGKETAAEQIVTTGLKGSDGNIEITSGLTEGDKVITFEKK